MTVVRADWVNARFSQTGPEAYAPPARRTPEPQVDNADPPLPRRQAYTADHADTPATADLDSLIRRVAAASMDGIDSTIRDLESVREMLRNEGQRVSGEVAEYASLSLSSMNAMKAIGESLRQFKQTRR